jgi:hypothetical protein
MTAITTRAWITPMSANSSNDEQGFTRDGSFAWVLYDGRAESGDTDDAMVLEAFASRRDLKSNLWHWCGHDGVLAEYDDDGKGNLTNERIIGHLREGKAALLAKCSRVKDNIPALKETP